GGIMKNKLSVVAGGIFMLLLCATYAGAQDWSKVNPKINHVLADTTFLRATEVTLAPGEKSDMHTHPAHFYYALTAGKMLVHYEDGKEETYDLKPGESGVGAPERPHMTTNVGKTTIKFLIVELKEHPYQPQAAKEIK